MQNTPGTHPTKPTMEPSRNNFGVKDLNVKQTCAGSVPEKKAFFDLIPLDGHSRTPIRHATDFDDTTKSIQEWNRRYDQLPQVMNPDSMSDQKNAQVKIDPNVTHGLQGNLNQGNESRLKDPPPQSSVPNPDGSPNQPPDISRQHKTPARGDLSGSGTSPPEDQDAKVSPPDFFEQEGPHHPSPVPAGQSKQDFVPPTNHDPLNIGIPGHNPESSLEACWSAGHQ